MTRRLQALVRWSTVIVLVAVWPVAAAAQHPTYSSGTTSSTCLQCHDGLVATNMNASMSVTSGTTSTGGSASDHPVGIDYVQAQAAWWKRLRPVALLPPEIQLVGGRVECSSCHDLSTGDTSRLVLTMSRSRLCFGCHAL